MYFQTTAMLCLMIKQREEYQEYLLSALLFNKVLEVQVKASLDKKL